jgi:glycerol uptake facilitator-like aquaporin
MLMSRRALSEFLGTALLVMAVVGSGIMAQNLTKDVALQLLANAIATGGALLGLITIFGPLSGASFNPVVSLVGYFTDRETSIAVLITDVVAQSAVGHLGREKSRRQCCRAGRRLDYRSILVYVIHQRC